MHHLICFNKRNANGLFQELKEEKKKKLFRFFKLLILQMEGGQAFLSFITNDIHIHSHYTQRHTISIPQSYTGFF